MNVSMKKSLVGMTKAQRSALVGRAYVKRMVHLWFVPVEFASSMPPAAKIPWWRAGNYYGRARKLNN